MTIVRKQPNLNPTAGNNAACGDCGFLMLK
jgi:hypothetical protein